VSDQWVDPYLDEGMGEGSEARVREYNARTPTPVPCACKKFLETAALCTDSHAGSLRLQKVFRNCRALHKRPEKNDKNGPYDGRLDATRWMETVTRPPTRAGKARFLTSNNAYQCNTPKRCSRIMTLIGTPSSQRRRSRPIGQLRLDADC
jgi:hypothetical protein